MFSGLLYNILVKEKQFLSAKPPLKGEVPLHRLRRFPSPFKGGML